MATPVLRVLVTAAALLAGGTVTPQDPYARAAAERGEPVQPVYSDDLSDPWNRLFSAMFTRTVRTRMTSEFAEAGPFIRLGENDFRRYPVSARTLERLEEGDRAITPFYPSFIHVLGMTPGITAERLTALEGLLAAAVADTRPRTPIDRVLMLADLWAVFDRLGPVDRGLPTRPRGLDAEIGRVTPLIARTIATLALTPAEIAALPDPYAAARRTVDLPDLFSPGSAWQEIVWLDHRMHDRDTAFRQATRVFVRPSSETADRVSLLNDLRGFASGPNRSEESARVRADRALANVDGVALVMQMLTVDAAGDVVPTPLIYSVQLRMFGAEGEPVVTEHELSRRLLRTRPETGGFTTVRGSDPGYVASAGNDYGFASPHIGSVREPILGTLATRCSSCHGSSRHMFTFGLHHALEEPPPVTLLDQPNATRARFVAHTKKAREDFKRLRALWSR